MEDGPVANTEAYPGGDIPGQTLLPGVDAEPNKRNRTTPEIAVDTIRRCRNEQAEEIAKVLVDQAPGMALDLRVALDKAIRARAASER